MPLESDYVFGKRAVETGHLTQEQLEECVEVLMALERAGTRKRLWDVIARKAYMTAEQITAARVGIESGSDIVPAAAKAETAKEETLDDLRFPAPEAGKFAIAYVSSRVRMHPLPTRALSVGSDFSCDIVLDALEAGEHRAEITAGHGRYMILSRTRAGILVNDHSVMSHELEPNDLVMLGSAHLLFLADYGDVPAPQPLRQEAVQGPQMAQLRVTTGAAMSKTFFVGARPIVIGRHALANARLKEPEVADFHAHVALTPEGFRIADLKSRAGVRVNGKTAIRHVLKENDNISLGPVGLTFSLVSVTASAEAGPAVPAEAQSEASASWGIDDNVEVEPATDPMMRAGLKPMRESPKGHRPLRPFKANELQLTCAEGPGEGRTFPLRKTKTVIGRDPHNDIPIEDPSISRRHAEVVLGPKFPFVRDMGSRNGIYVNGTRYPERPLKPGDTIRVGKSLLIIEESLLK